MRQASLPSSSEDSINRQILAVAEDQVIGFHARPFASIAAATQLPEELVMARLASMLKAGTIRRIRQTLLSTSLADGALIAWSLPEDKLEEAYEWLRAHDPFTGHIVIRSSHKADSPGAQYRLWTTLKVPRTYGTMEKHCQILKNCLGAHDFQCLPVRGMFALSVGHVRRASLKVGDKLPEPAKMQRPHSPELSEKEWSILLSLKESLSLDEICAEPWAQRAKQLQLSHEEYCQIAKQLDEKKVIGRFASFLDHQGKGGQGAGTRASGLFHWTVEDGYEEQAGSECGRHHCMTHCYWRSGGAAFGGAQIMGVVHGASREKVIEHKTAIDQHLRDCGIPVKHSAIFWSLKAEIRPSEIHPKIYQKWIEQHS